MKSIIYRNMNINSSPIQLSALPSTPELERLHPDEFAFQKDKYLPLSSELNHAQ